MARLLADMGYRVFITVNGSEAIAVFAEHKDELFAFLRFKLPVLVPGARPGDDLPLELTHYAEQTLARAGELIVGKNDAVFRCRSPLCP